MLHWFKKNFQQFEGSSWCYEGKGDEKIYESSIEHINEQMRLQKIDKLKNTIGELGFKEEKDYNGKMVLKSSVPTKKTLAFKEVQNMISRLKQDKKKAGQDSAKSKIAMKSTMQDSRQKR